MQNIGFSDSVYVIKPPLFTELRLLQGTIMQAGFESSVAEIR